MAAEDVLVGPTTRLLPTGPRPCRPARVRNQVEADALVQGKPDGGDHGRFAECRQDVFAERAIGKLPRSPSLILAVQLMFGFPGW